MPKQQFKAQADICKKALDILHKAIELDPGNAEEYRRCHESVQCYCKGL